MIDIESISDMFLKNIVINWIFYIGLIIGLFIFSIKSKTNLIINTISIILISMSGYFIHIIAHKYNFKKLCKKAIKHNSFITRHNFMKKITRYCGKIIDFHRDIHHNTSINKNLNNQIYEFIHNFVIQGLFIFIIIFISKRLNEKIALVWGLFYATIHIINYNIVKPKVHEQHHIDKFTNYGLDVWDILFNTKYDNICENYNHSVINIILIFYIISLL